MTLNSVTETTQMINSSSELDKRSHNESKFSNGRGSIKVDVPEEPKKRKRDILQESFSNPSRRHPNVLRTVPLYPCFPLPRLRFMTEMVEKMIKKKPGPENHGSAKREQRDYS